MDPIRNPYAPGAGTQPPELAGRTLLLEQARIVLERLRGERRFDSAQALIEQMHLDVQQTRLIAAQA